MIDALYLYAASVVLFLVVAIGIALYEQWLITSRIVDCGLWVGNLENIKHLALISVIPIVNIFATMMSIGYFAVEHAPYIMDDIMRKKKNDLASKKSD